MECVGEGCAAAEPLFTKRVDVLPQDLVNLEVARFGFKFDRHLDSSAVGMPVKFHSDAIIITFNLAVSRLC